MRKAFRDAYERELDILYERSAEFAEEFPGLAERLGGVLRENIDPTIAGLLEGTAFLAARVQLKLDEEFRGFTTELLEQIFPDALAPIPSCMIVQAPPLVNQNEGVKRHQRGEYLDARFRDAEKRVACRFSLTAPLDNLPLTVSGLTYHDQTTTISGLGQDVDPATRAGLQIDLRRTDGAQMRQDPQDALTFHLTADHVRAIAAYEQIHCSLTRVSLRWLQTNGDPAFLRLSPKQVEQIGFDRDEGLFDSDRRLFEGFAILRDFFVFPRKFLGFRLTGLRPVLSAIPSTEVQLIFEFDRSNDELARQIQPKDIRLNCAPAINLFQESSNQVRLDDKRHEYVVTPDPSPVTHYEIQRLISVQASYGTASDRVDVTPLYALPNHAAAQRSAYYYTARRKPRRLTEAERRAGQRHDYRGTETFIAVHEPPGAVVGRRAQRLHIKALCSNRHLPAVLPLAGSDDFAMVSDQALSLTCVNGPTAPREAMTEVERSGGPHRMNAGDVYWRLISYLSLNHFGLDDRFGRDGAASLREILTLFADASDHISEVQIAGLTGLNVRPITRSIRRPEGNFPARGLELTLSFDETAFEGSGIILLGAVLDRFLAEYASINSFTQTILNSRQRGIIKRFPPRTGLGPLI